MYGTVMPVSAYMALAFVFGFIQINLMMMMMNCMKRLTRCRDDGRVSYVAYTALLSGVSISTKCEPTATKFDTSKTAKRACYMLNDTQLALAYCSHNVRVQSCVMKHMAV